MPIGSHDMPLMHKVFIARIINDSSTFFSVLWLLEQWQQQLGGLGFLWATPQEHYRYPGILYDGRNGEF